jgi:hypothetical protein
MERRPIRYQSSTTETVDKKDELKHLVLTLKSEAEVRFNEQAESIKEEIKDMDEDELDLFVNLHFEGLYQLFTTKSNLIREKILRCRPEKPKPEQFESPEKYAEALLVYEKDVCIYLLM